MSDGVGTEVLDGGGSSITTIGVVGHRWRGRIDFDHRDGAPVLVRDVDDVGFSAEGNSVGATAHGYGVDDGLSESIDDGEFLATPPRNVDPVGPRIDAECAVAGGNGSNGGDDAIRVVVDHRNVVALSVSHVGRVSSGIRRYAVWTASD